jgi:hypothetical protein
MTGGVAMVACLALAGVANAAAPSLRLKPGTQWTQTNLSNNGCEVETIGSNGTFSADKFGDKGTVTISGKIISETWTTGNDSGQTLKAHWSHKDNEYRGNGHNASGGQKWHTTLVMGDNSKC